MRGWCESLREETESSGSDCTRLPSGLVTFASHRCRASPHGPLGGNRGRARCREHGRRQGASARPRSGEVHGGLEAPIWTRDPRVSNPWVEIFAVVLNIALGLAKRVEAGAGSHVPKLFTELNRVLNVRAIPVPPGASIAGMVRGLPHPARVWRRFQGTAPSPSA